MKYNLEDRPKAIDFLLYGLQWWAVSLPCVIIMGVVVARLHYAGLGDQIFYLQKLFGLCGLAMAGQILVGHRLPLVVGPATILLAGLLATLSSGPEAIYSSIIIGGALLAACSAAGLLGRLRKFFTPRIIAVILVLIAFTISPTILKLTLGDGHEPVFHLLFGFGLALFMIIINQLMPGIWKSMTVLLGLAGGSFLYFTFTAFPALPPIPPPAEAGFLVNSFVFEPGVALAFIFCMLGLIINELGSIESIGHMLRADKMEERARRGVTFMGLSNMLAGALAVLGPVSFSLSAGIISATGCAARRVLLPAAFGLILCALAPQAVLICSLLPGAVMGALMLYLMAAQISSGLAMLVAEKGVSDFAGGLTVGFPLMGGLLISFAPAAAFQELPALIRPVISNGFVMGTILVIMLEHVIIRAKQNN